MDRELVWLMSVDPGPPEPAPAPPGARRSPWGAFVVVLTMAARIAGVLLGSLAAAVVLAVVLTATLPLSRDARFAIGFLALLPLWVTGICLGFLAGKR